MRTATVFVMPTRPSLFAERVAVFTLGLYLTGRGIATVSAGRMTDSNYLHIHTSAVSSIAVGVSLVALGTFAWKWLSPHL